MTNVTRLSVKYYSRIACFLMSYSETTYFRGTTEGEAPTADVLMKAIQELPTYLRNTCQYRYDCMNLKVQWG
jgi:hypothetical protein